MTTGSPLSDLGALLSSIEVAADTAVGVDSFEHLLVELLGLLKSGRVERAEAVFQLGRLTTEWPPGAVEVLEFTMRQLRWPEIREALEDHQGGGADFRTRNQATRALQAFEDDWPAGDIYETFRQAQL